MKLVAVKVDSISMLEGPPDGPFMAGTDDATRLVEACLSHRVGSVLLYAQNLPERFFDLSSGQAGAILQKLRNYHVRLAVVCRPGSVQFSSRFAEMVAEARRGRSFGVFETREAALEWLGRE
jgi:hypothetical protein